MGSNQAENKLSEEQGHNHRMELLPLWPGFPSSECCVLCVCVHSCWLISAKFGRGWNSKASIPYQVAKMQSHEHQCGRGTQGSAAGRSPGPSEGCAWAWPAPPAHPRPAEIRAEKAKGLQSSQGPYLLSMNFSGKNQCWMLLTDPVPKPRGSMGSDMGTAAWRGGDGRLA